MKCPLCNKELETKNTSPESICVGQINYLACPTIFSKQLGKGFLYINHYQLWDTFPNGKAEIAYVPPYRVHNLFDKGYCEVSDCSENAYQNKETAVLFKCPPLIITSETTLKNRIKLLLLFS